MVIVKEIYRLLETSVLEYEFIARGLPWSDFPGHIGTYIPLVFYGF